MTVALVLSAAPATNRSLGQGWVTWLTARSDATYVLAPAAFDAGPIDHAAAGPDDVDVLTALSDLARHIDDDLLLIDGSQVRSPDQVAVPAPARAQGIGPESAPGYVRVARADLADVAGLWRRCAAERADARSPLRPAFEQARDAWLTLQTRHLASPEPTPAGPVAAEAATRARRGDGPYTAAVVRPVAGWLAARWVRAGWGASSVTVLAAGAGLAAAIAAAAGSLPALLVALVLVQLCLAGLLAASDVAETAEPSPSWHWLQGMVAATAAFAVVIGVAQGSDFAGVDVWGLALVASALWGGAWLLAAAAWTLRSPGANDPAATEAGPSVVWWCRPGGEVVVALALVLLVRDSRTAAWVAVGWGAVALLTVFVRQRGPVARRHIASPRARRQAEHRLVRQADPGPLALLVGRQDPDWSVLRRLVTTRVGWLLPTALLAVEAAVLVVLFARWAPSAMAIATLALAITVLHRFDTVWRQSTAGSAAASWAFVLGLGALGRSVTYVVLAAAGELVSGLSVLAVVWATLFAAEAASSWTGRDSSAA